MTALPRDPAPDSTLGLVAEGYEFVTRRCDRLGTDAFVTRLLLRPTICMRGHDAARLVYDDDRFERSGAAPPRLLATLFGEGGVQGLDGAAHRRRKGLFMGLVGPQEEQDRIVAAFDRRWRSRQPLWESADDIVLLDEVGLVLTEAVHDWTGVPLPRGGVRQRYRDLRAMIEGGGRLGPGYVRGRRARRRAEREIAAVVAAVRAGRLDAVQDRPLAVVAGFRDLDGRHLEPRVAAVELLNLLRPVVAVDRFIAFVALALHAHPTWRRRLSDGDDAAVTPFVQEVRRHYPFFPFVAARTRRDFEWRGMPFPRGRRVLLDLYATDHDPRSWASPGRFRPERFADREIGAYDLIPQGGGDHATGHRCPGEWFTIALMSRAVELLTREMDWEVPPQDLHVARGRMPAMPASGMRLRGVRARA